MSFTGGNDGAGRENKIKMVAACDVVPWGIDKRSLPPLLARGAGLLRKASEKRAGAEGRLCIFVPELTHGRLVSGQVWDGRRRARR
jgi:hypothetical protein